MVERTQEQLTTLSKYNTILELISQIRTMYSSIPTNHYPWNVNYNLDGIETTILAEIKRGE